MAGGRVARKLPARARRAAGGHGGKLPWNCGAAELGGTVRYYQQARQGQTLSRCVTLMFFFFLSMHKRATSLRTLLADVNRGLFGFPILSNHLVPEPSGIFLSRRREQGRARGIGLVKPPGEPNHMTAFSPLVSTGALVTRGKATHTPKPWTRACFLRLG